MTGPLSKPGIIRDIGELFRRVVALERAQGGGGGGGCGDWNNVGEVGQPAFQNSWDNVGGAEAPVAFMLCGDMVHLRGAFTGGGAGTVVFTLPLGYRPEFQQEMVIPTTDDASYATCIVATNGDVTYLNTVT